MGLLNSMGIHPFLPFSCSKLPNGVVVCAYQHTEPVNHSMLDEELNEDLLQQAKRVAQGVLE